MGVGTVMRLRGWPSDYLPPGATAKSNLGRRYVCSNAQTGLSASLSLDVDSVHPKRDVGHLWFCDLLWCTITRAGALGLCPARLTS